MRSTSQSSLSKQLLLPPHPMPTPSSEGCGEPHPPLLCTRAADAAVPSILPFLKPSSCFTQVSMAPASLLRRCWDSPGHAENLVTSSKQSSSNKKKEKVTFRMLKSVAGSTHGFCTVLLPVLQGLTRVVA